MFGVGTDGPPVLHDVAGDRDGDPHDHHCGEKKHAIQNTHRGQNNKLRARPRGRGVEWPPIRQPGAHLARIDRMLSII